MKIRIPGWLVQRLLRFAFDKPYFNLAVNGEPYMDRWWCMPRWCLKTVGLGDGSSELRPKSWLPVVIRVHRIITSDSDRHLHDHPFDNISWLLRGGYWELLPVAIDPQWSQEPVSAPNAFAVREKTSTVFRPEGSIIRRRASDRHAIRLVPGQQVFSLFIQFRKCQPWGFYTPRGKVYWWDYSTVVEAGTGAPTRRMRAISGGQHA